MKPVGIHHVNILFDNIDAARAFYGETLGFDEIERPDFGFPGLWFQMGAQQLHLGPGSAPDSFQHFALEVDDLEAARAVIAETSRILPDASFTGIRPISSNVAPVVRERVLTALGRAGMR